MKRRRFRTRRENLSALATPLPASAASGSQHEEGALSQASLRPHKADDLAVVRLSVRTVQCQHEEISLTVWCIV